MSLRRLLPVRKKAAAGEGVKTLQDQDPLPKSTDLTGVAQNAEVAIQAPSEIPASSHAGTARPTAEPMRGVGQGNEGFDGDQWGRVADNSSNSKYTPAPGGDGESSKTAASSKRSPEVARDVRAMPRRHRAVTLIPGSGKPPEGWEVMPDEVYGVPYLLNHNTGATTLGFSPGWEVREDEEGVYFVDHNTRTATSTDPRFAVDPIKEATERLALRHTTRPHSCEHCKKIVVDFKKTLLKKTMLRSEFDNVRVRCADILEDIYSAQRGGCPFFIQLFRNPLSQSDVCLEDGGVFITVKQSRVDDEFDETWRKHCFIFYKSKRLWNEDYPISKLRLPKLRLCGDPQPGQYFMLPWTRENPKLTPSYSVARQTQSGTGSRWTVARTGRGQLGGLRMGQKTSRRVRSGPQRMPMEKKLGPQESPCRLCSLATDRCRTGPERSPGHRYAGQSTAGSYIRTSMGLPELCMGRRSDRQDDQSKSCKAPRRDLTQSSAANHPGCGQGLSRAGPEIPVGRLPLHCSRRRQ